MGQTILVVDDSPTLRKFIVKHLQAHSANYRVLVAANGADGVDLAKKEKPDLILLDFILPDMNGEEVCKQLVADPETAGIPVVLMSSSAPDITRTEGKFEIIKRSMVKPFSPELLCATVSYVFKSAAEQARETSMTEAGSAGKTSTGEQESGTDSSSGGTLVFCGETDYFPLLHALLASESRKLTGVLLVRQKISPIEIYFREGELLLATTRDIDAYLSGTPLDIPPEQEELFKDLKQTQTNTGSPIFLQMRDKDLAPTEDAESMADQFGASLASGIWLQPVVFLEFRKSPELPAFIGSKKPASNSVLSWSLETLRLVGTECLALAGSENSTGVPSYTKTGYERIQKLPLNDEEVAFANQVASGGLNLNDIAAGMGIDPEAARQLLFRFRMLEIFDYWTETSATP
ncbi:MAG: response regulator [Methylacidiphilales bacterium]|nr:response regulator [Candidatus Methylacidiphilales bacterium]